jgi:peptidoglycan hydrolase-like protein with peptidoglycan-binding domain
MEFQKQKGLKVDGIVGKETWEALAQFYVSEKKE